MKKIINDKDMPKSELKESVVNNILLSNVVDWKQQYFQYIRELKNYIDEENWTINDFVRPSDWLVLDNQGQKPIATTFKSNFVYSSNVFNTSLYGDSSSEISTVSKLEDSYKIQMIKKQFQPNISSMWVFYDSNGTNTQSIDEGTGTDAEYNNARFDNLELMKQNIINNKKVTINSDYVYVDTKDDGKILLKNIISNIYSFSYDHSDKYFRSFEDLKSYIISYIKNNSYLTRR